MESSPTPSRSYTHFINWNATIIATTIRITSRRMAEFHAVTENNVDDLEHYELASKQDQPNGDHTGDSPGMGLEEEMVNPCFDLG